MGIPTLPLTRIARALPGSGLALAFVLLALGGCARSRPGTLDSVRFAVVPSEGHALHYIAEQRGFFAKNDIAAVFKNVETPAAGLDALARGEVDLVQTGESLVVGRVLLGEKIRVIASTNKVFSLRLVGRRDRGIGEPADLAGKRIGLSRQTSAEFYLGRFLELRGLPAGEVTIVDLPPSRWVEAVSDGSVDAAVVRGPDAQAIRERTGDGVVVWSVQENQPIFGVLSGRADWIGGHPEQVQRVLKALAEAEDYAVQHPEEAKAIVGKVLGSAAATLEAVWPDYRFTLSLDLSLLMAMAEEARWMIARRLTGATAAPDFLEYIHLDGLQAIRPDAMDIVPSE